MLGFVGLIQLGLALPIVVAVVQGHLSRRHLLALFVVGNDWWLE